MASGPASLLAEPCDALTDSAAAGAWFGRLDWPVAHEAVAAVLLDEQMTPIRTEWVGQGGASSTPLFTRALAALVLISGARGLVLAHNHPSGCAHASPADRRLTRELGQLLAALDVVLLDHLILGRGGWCSMRDAGLF